METCREIGRGRGTLGRSMGARLGLSRSPTLGKSIFALLGLSLCAPTLGRSTFVLLGLSLCASTDPAPRTDPPEPPPTTPDPLIPDVGRRGIMNLSAKSPVRGGDVESGDGRCGDVDNCR